MNDPNDNGTKRPSPDPSATATFSVMVGNPLFEQAVEAIGLDDGTTRWFFVSVLNMIGASPGTLTPDEVGVALPEVDRRLRQLVLAAQADAAMARLYKVLFACADPG